MKCEELLLDENIINILIGDKSINKDIIYPVNMPYLRGIDICNIANDIGFKMPYNEGLYKGYSRKNYMKDLIKYCIKENKISNLFNEITRKNKFKFLAEDSFLYRGDSNMQYYEMMNDFYTSVNELLNFDNAYFIHNDNVWSVESFDEEIKIEIPKEELNLKFVKEEYEKALNDIKNNNYKHAISLCRTLLEDVFVKMLNEKNIEFKQNGEIKTYYKLIKDNYNLKTGTDIDKNINELLSSLESIVNAITELRNKAGDSHAFQNKKYNLKDYHIKLMINSSISLSEFLIELMNDSKEE